MQEKLKFFILLFMAIFSFGNSYSQEQLVKLTNLENVSGMLYIGWYNNPPDFRKNEKAVYREKIHVQNQAEVKVPFKNIPSGQYAIAAFLDQNNNYKLDKNLFGVPIEKYGFSNNILPMLRAATFRESVFDLSTNDTIIHINLK